MAKWLRVVRVSQDIERDATVVCDSRVAQHRP